MECIQYLNYLLSEPGYIFGGSQDSATLQIFTLGTAPRFTSSIRKRFEFSFPWLKLALIVCPKVIKSYELPFNKEYMDVMLDYQCHPQCYNYIYNNTTLCDSAQLATDTVYSTQYYSLCKGLQIDHTARCILVCLEDYKLIYIRVLCPIICMQGW